MDDIDSEWQQFCDEENKETQWTKQPQTTKGVNSDINNDKEKNDIPISNALYISTQTIISFLNTPVDLNNIFWQLPIIPYHLPTEGIIKKQIKFNTQTPEELNHILAQKQKYDYVDEYIITHVDNPTGRIKFKDVRKISVGISKKDITSYRCKRKSAFYNCVVLIIRMLDEAIYKEIHIKIFNTGKLEIPGIKNERILHKVYAMLVGILTPFIKQPIKLAFMKEKTQVVLINSNFKCGYYLKREVLNDIFKKKYNNTIRSIYDPCTYPGIQCEIYYNQSKEEQGIVHNLNVADIKTKPHISKVSFMVFRTGSVLIVGKCSETILQHIYEFLRTIFTNEHNVICETNSIKLLNISAKKKSTSRMKSIMVLE